MTPTRLRARLRRRLEIDPARHPRGVPHLAAASGLVRVGRWLHLVADDEHHLATVDARGRRGPIDLHRLFPGTLPGTKAARKRRKPDLEGLLAIEGVDGAATALVALGSGSRPSRRRGAWVDLDAEGRPAGPARTFALDPLYDAIDGRFHDTNIEGAFRAGDRLCLLQRANAGDPRNAVVSWPWVRWLAWVRGAAADPGRPRIVEADLGADARGVPFGFTDGAALGADAFAFSAVAEATDDAYADGASGGSMLGLAGVDGRVLDRVRLAGRWKVEGIAVRRDARDPRVLILDLVTDADDPDAASALLRARWRVGSAGRV